MTVTKSMRPFYLLDTLYSDDKQVDGCAVNKLCLLKINVFLGQISQIGFEKFMNQRKQNYTHCNRNKYI